MTSTIRTSRDAIGAASIIPREAGNDDDLDAMTVLSFPEEGRIVADIRQQIESQCQAIGMADHMIAATWIAADNVLHFERITDLKLSGRSTAGR